MEVIPEEEFRAMIGGEIPGQAGNDERKDGNDERKDGNDGMIEIKEEGTLF